METRGSSFWGLPYRVLNTKPKKGTTMETRGSSFWGLPYRVLNTKPKKELQWRLGVVPFGDYLIGF